MGLPRFPNFFSKHAAPVTLPDAQPAAPAASASLPAKPVAARPKLPSRSPAWALKLRFNPEGIRRKKASPPVSLSGANWMKQYDQQKQVTLKPDMTVSVLQGALRRVSYMDDTKLMWLAEDIGAVLATYNDTNKNLQKEADKYFRATYANLFNKTSYSFENANQRELMRKLGNAIKVNAAEKAVASVPTASSAPVAPTRPTLPTIPVEYPGFNAAATNLAFTRILNAHLEYFSNAQNSSAAPVPASAVAEPPTVPVADSKVERIKKGVQHAAQAITISARQLKKLKIENLPHLLTVNAASGKSATQAAASLAPEASPSNYRHADDGVRRAVEDMELGNTRLRSWLATNNIEAVANSGVGLNCLIIALLQHATGAYGSEFEPGLADLAGQLREGLAIEPGMLYSDDVIAARIVARINSDYSTNMVAVEVQANESGQPVISTPLNGMPDGERVVIWQRGNHFEALRAKDPQPAF